jgi:general secretion pathway protein C
MSRNSNTKNLSLLITVLAVLLLVKLLWVAVEYLYLPEKGISSESGQAKKSLHYRYRFASDVALPKVEVPVSKPVKKAASIRDIKLVGIYSGKNSCIVTLLKKGKSHILSKGDDIDGFVLKRASAREAYFEKNSKSYTLKLFETKQKGSASVTAAQSSAGEQTPQKQTEEKISSKDGIKSIPRSMLKTYVSDMDKAMRDIGLRPVKRNNQMLGYKVRFIRKGSPFSQLGLQRGDVIKAINGEEIVDFNGPMSILKSADSIEGLSITIVRKNEEKELEYEVK